MSCRQLACSTGLQQQQQQGQGAGVVPQRVVAGPAGCGRRPSCKLAVALLTSPSAGWRTAMILT